MALESGFWQTMIRHMKTGHLREAGTEMLVGAIMMLIAGMILLGANISELHDINLLVDRSNRALLQVAEVDNMTIGVEMTARGYALTGNPVFRTYQNRNIEVLHTAVNRLAVLVSDQPAQTRIVVKLRPLVERQIAIHRRLANLPSQRAGEVAAAIVDPAIRQVRYTLLRTLYDIRDAQLKLVAERQRQSEREVEQTFILSVGVVGLAFLLAAMGLFLVRGGLAEGTAPRT